LYLKLYKCYLILSSVHFLCCFIIFVLYQFISGEGKMSEKDVYLQETKAITYGFYNLVCKLKKRGYRSAAYFLDVAFLAYNQDVEEELNKAEAV